MLTFNSIKHEYRWNGQLVPHVTEIIQTLIDLSMVPASTLERARQEGIAIHRMMELDCKGDLDVENLPEWMRQRYVSWCMFKEDTGFELIASEEKMYDQILGYAGRPDLFCLLPKLKHFNKGVANIDLKRSLYAGPAIGLQTAAYSELYNRRHTERVRHRGALVLNDKGTYRLTPYEDADDWTAFLALLTTYRWKQKHGCA